MSSNDNTAVQGGTEIDARVEKVINELIMDWDLDLPGGIGPDTTLMDNLGFESIDVVQLVVSLEQEFGVKGLPFEQLFMRDGDYVDELKVSELTGFLRNHI